MSFSVFNLLAFSVLPEQMGWLSLWFQLQNVSHSAALTYSLPAVLVARCPLNHPPRRSVENEGQWQGTISERALLYLLSRNPVTTTVTTL